ncbi:MAG TPA: aminopeptidase [Gemmatimonadaceae bacterium]|jgi:predicted aminopeptidase
MRLRWGSVGVALLIACGGVALVTAGTRTGRYLVRAAWAEGKILRGRRAIADLVRDSTTDAVTRGKLQLVLAARAYAADTLGFPAKDAFTKYTRLKSDTLVLVLSGAARDTLAPVTWWFPIVGRVPYKGFFDVKQAQREEQRLRDRGFDAYLRPAPAFSTLGFFNDPVLSTTLSADSAEVANTVVHELTHNRYYAAGSAVFNESFANFVGARGAAAFFRSRGDTLNAALCDRRWEDQKRLGAFWTRVVDSLEVAYAAHPGPAGKPARLEARDRVYAWARRLLVDSVGPTLTTYPTWYAARVRLDNAALLARRVYMTDLGRFDAVWESEEKDLRRTVERIVREHRALR